MENFISQKKQSLIDAYLSEPIKKGDKVEVLGLGIQNKKSWGNIAVVKYVLSSQDIEIESDRSLSIVKAGDYRKWLGEVGIYPFPKNIDRIQSINFSLESVLFSLGLTGDDRNEYFVEEIPVMRCSFNPFIYDELGKKIYYQRPLVWSVDDKRLLIDSIYNSVDCGKILVRNRSWAELNQMVKNGETEIAFKDVVDGKQRLNAVADFIKGEFSDSQGNFFSDLSKMAQRKFTDHQLFSYSELPENSSDKDVKNQFLKLNFAGVPQSKEHIEFVKNINL
jgi:hypothetical protein